MSLLICCSTKTAVSLETGGFFYKRVEVGRTWETGRVLAAGRRIDPGSTGVFVPKVML